MKITTATTYSGSPVIVNKRAYRKAVKSYILGLTKPFPDANPEQCIKHQRAKNSSFNHSLDMANLYSLKVVGRNVFVI